MDARRKEHQSASHTVHVVQFLVSIPRSKKKGQNRVLCCKKKYDRDLSNRKETCNSMRSKPNGRMSVGLPARLGLDIRGASFMTQSKTTPRYARIIQAKNPCSGR